MISSENPSSDNNYPNDANEALLCATCETNDSTSGESQCRGFRWTLEGRIENGVSPEGVMESVNGVDWTSPCVRVDFS